MLAFLCCIFGAVTTAQARTTGNIAGFVRNVDGKALSNTEVRLISRSELRATRTDTHGFYSFMAVEPSIVALYFERPGYNPTSMLCFISTDNSMRVVVHLRQWIGDISRAPASSFPDFLVSDQSLDSYIVPQYLLEHQTP